ncbi:MAG: murein hydrolase activator EnvC [Sphingomicrobium sp.]|nr:peptidoglycan DD-metalloendopeptidase family protein [Sphingomonadales bacterium]
MHRLLPLVLLIATPVLAAPDQPLASPERQLADARAEVARASAEEQRLTAETSRAGNEVAKLAGEQRAAGAAIAAAEARIDAAKATLAIARAAEAAQQQRLAERQAPAAALLAGLVSMGRRPPLLALADGSAEEFVRVRALLDATLPAIRARTAALSTGLAAARRTQQIALAARDDLARQRAGLDQQRTRFAELEQRALTRQAQLAAQALGAGDVTLAGGETLADLSGEANRRSAGLAAAHELARLDPLPSRPLADPVRPPATPFPYRLPAEAPVIAGLGSVDPNGVRSRGLTLGTGRGTTVIAPADGTIAFAGPYRRADGVVIIDHGDGWKSLIVNVATTLPKGSRVHLGDPLGRALGSLQVELSRDGANVSPAFIAASSAMLSNRSKPS